MRIRPTHALVVTAVVAGAAAVVPAMAQDLPTTRIDSHATATPNRAGTAAHPRGTSISATAHLTVEKDFEPPIVTGIDILVGPGLTWNGGKFVQCRKAALDRRGPSGCPPASIMGSAVATGQADTVAARLDLTFINGGAGTIYAYASLDNPARVRETLVVKESRFASGTWRHRESVSVPQDLQIVAGVPLQLNSIRMKVGGRSYARKYITSTSCPKGGWKYQVTAHYLYDAIGKTDDNVSGGSIACTK